jgi:CDP-diglyceride synthetase
MRARTDDPAEPAAQGYVPGGWGGAGAPTDYDPGAPTGPEGVAAATAIEDIGDIMEYPREVRSPVAVPVAATRTMSGGEGTELPHWADPPTGEVPSALAGPDGDEMQAWHLLGARGLHWRDDLNGWSNGPGVEDLVDEDDMPLGHDEGAGDPFSFDEDFERLERERSQLTGPMAAIHPDADAEVEDGEVGEDGVVGRSGPAGARVSGLGHGAQGRAAGGVTGDEYDPGDEGGYGAGDEAVEESRAVLDVFPASLAARRLRETAGAGAARAGTRSGAGRNGTGRNGTGRSGTGRSGSGRNGTGRSGSGRNGTGRNGTGRNGNERTGRSVRAGEPAPSAEGSQMARPVSPAPGAANYGGTERNGGPPGHLTGRRASTPYDVNAEAALGRPGRNVGAAVATGAGLVVVFVVCYLVGPGALVALSTVAILGCALEAFSMLQEVGFRPATLVGALGSGGAVLAVYWKGTAALPVVVAVVLAASFLWYLARVVEARPVVNVAVTFLVFAWVGVMGSFAGLLLAAHKGGHLFLGAVVPTVLCDVAAWFVGSRIGSHPLAPQTSPGKTWEGVIAGAVVAVVAGAVIGHSLSPWGGLRHGVELGVVIAIVAPVGDLVQSMVKRDLRLKDSGALLPGHGGLLDRFDSMLFVLPAVYFLATGLHLAG